MPSWPVCTCLFLQGIVNAASAIGLQKPIVARLQGIQQFIPTSLLFAFVLFVYAWHILVRAILLAWDSVHDTPLLHARIDTYWRADYTRCFDRGVTGTNVEEARKILDGSGFKMLQADDLDDAAEKAVKIADIVTQAEKISVGVSFGEMPL